MKSINLRGVKESLSDGEMKLVKGGQFYDFGPETEARDVQLDGGGGGGSDSCNWYKCYCEQPSSPVIIANKYPIVQAANAVDAVYLITNSSDWGCWMYNSVGCTFDKKC